MIITDTKIEDDDFVIDWDLLGVQPDNPYLFNWPVKDSPSPCDDVPELPEVFSTDIFSIQPMPAAYYLDPEGYSSIRNRYKSPTHRHWQKLCPNIYKAAVAILNGISETYVDWEGKSRRAGPQVWGRNQVAAATWVTFTAGKSAGYGKWRHKRMQLIDILNALGNPFKFSVGSRAGDESHQLRLDIDMDKAYFHRDYDAIKQELTLEYAVLRSIGLNPCFFRTGNRGHQIVIPVPDRKRAVLQFLMGIIKYLLRNYPRAVYSDIKVDKSNLDGLVRLPLGRHAFTDSVGWMIDPDTSELFPIDRQVEAVTKAFTTACSFSLLDDIPTDIPDGAAPALQHIAGTRFQMAVKECCNQFGIPYPEHHAPIAAMPEAPTSVSVCKTLTSNIGLGWAKGVIEEGFEPGGFWAWAHNSNEEGHKNGIGAAILFWGSEVPGDLSDPEVKQRRDEYVIDKLIEYVQEVPAVSEKDMQQRINNIRWMVPENNIDRFYSHAALRQHKEIDGKILESETELAEKVVEILVQKRAVSTMRRKKFDDKALKTVQHIVELLQVAFRESKDGRIQVSQRTLLAEIETRWADDATSQKDIERQLKWITSGDNKCLFEILEPDCRRRSFDAQEYVMGKDYVALIPIE